MGRDRGLLVALVTTGMICVLLAQMAASGGGFIRTHALVAPPASSWPNATNTGVPAGTNLTSWLGGCTITTANTVIDSKLVDCTSGALDIRANGVQITNSKVLGQVWLDTDVAGASGWNVAITDSEVDAGFQQLPAVGVGNFTVLRSNIHGGQTAAQCEAGSADTSASCYVQDSYLHGQAIPVNAQWHLGGVLTEGGNNTFTLLHNYVICDGAQYPPDGGCTGDINLIAHFGVMQNITISNNKMGASADLAFCTLGGISPENPNTNHIIYTDNVFERGPTGICGAYGPVSNFESGGVGNVWTNNKYDDGTVVDPA